MIFILSEDEFPFKEIAVNCVDDIPLSWCISPQVSFVCKTDLFLFCLIKLSKELHQHLPSKNSCHSE